MMRDERAVCYCQAIWANKQFKAATPLSRDELWQEGLERKSPEGAAVEEPAWHMSAQPMVGSLCDGAGPWWAQSRVGSAQNLPQPTWDGQGS